jgi:hypothetical protein
MLTYNLHRKFLFFYKGRGPRPTFPVFLTEAYKIQYGIGDGFHCQNYYEVNLYKLSRGIHFFKNKTLDFIFCFIEEDLLEK